MDRSAIPNDTRHQGVPSGASKLISKHTVCSMQTMHLPCIRISIISKLTEPSFHLSLFTPDYQIVCPKWFLRLWCIRCKLCTYLALKLTMSTNGPKQDSLWHTQSPSLVLVINDTKLLMPCVLVIWDRHSNTCDEGAWWHRKVATWSQRDEAWSEEHGDKQGAKLSRQRNKHSVLLLPV